MQDETVQESQTQEYNYIFGLKIPIYRKPFFIPTSEPVADAPST